MKRMSSWSLLILTSIVLLTGGCGSGSVTPTNNQDDNVPGRKTGPKAPPETSTPKSKAEAPMSHKELPFTAENDWEDHPELKRPIPWAHADKADRAPENWIVYKATVDGARWTIRMNDFPAEPLYTLLINGEPIMHFNNWPVFWKKPD
jgi:hypothetical protein